ncbi:hypothetical protein TVAG_221230 [Trichomonas vaginalis G3]|uniref:Uncharacterized protein n=1 Tax=Trichomonas vaginalis (strain ATCC PRA-98 / G3) TaxID=412133 RepID=A2FWX9_TRIV3|nr:hypothetical protein TVAGG3_0033780 [Trichomonas vaginalis G3]EAX90580.1 hypothetical protein TVAG_221230 [Trichomonas vaginalis G3]KAI5540269.1 hypothetical protein TVAGG3_0033780 [Trichomonas vaginalis G3]|eukprot:XP_001303510.1 hypothetical protein [Trichomonas vaginalis G3]
MSKRCTYMYICQILAEDDELFDANTPFPDNYNSGNIQLTSTVEDYIKAINAAHKDEFQFSESFMLSKSFEYLTTSRICIIIPESGDINYNELSKACHAVVKAICCYNSFSESEKNVFYNSVIQAKLNKLQNEYAFRSLKELNDNQVEEMKRLNEEKVKEMKKYTMSNSKI